MIGGQAGCDYSFAAGWIVGLEGRAAWSGLTNTRNTSVTFPAIGLIVPARTTVTNDLLTSATARLGYRFASQWLLFASGGAAWTHEKQDDAFISPRGVGVDPSAATIRTGWTAGIGLDYAFAPHWSAVVDYRYYDFGSQGALLTSSNDPIKVNNLNLKDTIHQTSVGVNYHF